MSVSTAPPTAVVDTAAETDGIRTIAVSQQELESAPAQFCQLFIAPAISVDAGRHASLVRMSIQAKYSALCLFARHLVKIRLIATPRKMTPRVDVRTCETQTSS